MARPAITPVPSPPLPPAAEAAEARDGELPELTPLQMSPVAPRVGVGAGAAGVGVERAGLLVAELLLEDFGAADFGAVELENTGVPASEVTPAVAPATRAGMPAEGVLLPVLALLRAGELLWLGVAPLVVPEALDEEGAPADGAGAGVAAAADGAGAGVTASGATGAGAAGTPEVAGGAVGVCPDGGAGVAGVPKPDGVQAQAMPAPTTPTQSTDNTAVESARARLRISHSSMQLVDG